MQKLIKGFENLFFWQYFQRWFGLEEIENSKVLQIFAIFLLVGFWLSFEHWIGFDTARTSHNPLCWPFFQSCTDWYIIDSKLPDGYSQNIFYSGLFGFIFGGLYLAYFQRWKGVYLILWILFLWKCYITFTSFYTRPNFELYHTIFTLIFLCVPHKKFFLRLSDIWFYFLAAAVKFHPGWILGTYFTSLQLGMPIFPDSLAPVWTNVLIFIQLFGVWFLFSQNKIWRSGILLILVGFHLYSAILVGYRFPFMAGVPLLILFAYEPLSKLQVPIDKKSILGWCVIVFLFIAQMISHLIPGDEKITLEGNFYGQFMFEANHQCVYRVKEKETVLNHGSINSARQRCDPYTILSQFKRVYCVDGGTPKSWTLDHSINGGPFYRVVDVPDLCTLEYKPFGRNSWINAPEWGAPAVGRPVKNLYY